MNVSEFLSTVITSDDGKLLVCSRNHTIPWTEEWYDWPIQQALVSKRLEFLHDGYDVYFTSHLFSEEASLKANVKPTRTIQADLDAANVYPIEPTILVQTSPQRYQGYWILKEGYDVEPAKLEELSKRLTYNIENSDHSGWSLGHRLRVPGTLNFKYTNGPHEISIVGGSESEYIPEDFELLPAIPASILALQDTNFLDTVDDIALGGPMEFLHSVKDKIPAGVYFDYVNKTIASGPEGRSGALWSLMCSLFECGLTREQVFWLAKHSPNNKFAIDLRYNANRELAKDVERAEKKVKIKVVDFRGGIDVMRNMPTPQFAGGALFKRRQIYKATKLAMDHSGKFVKVIAGLPYFLPDDTGRPIALTPGSEHLRAVLHLRYGINSADPEYKYVHDGLIDEGISIENEIDESTFSYYNGETLYVHSGRKEVFKIEPNKISIIENASEGILFPWHDMFDPMLINLNEPYDGDWADAVFGDLHNTTNMSPAAAKALLKSWLIFSLFRSIISTRPILALFGSPGSGKSTIPHKIYALFYSRRLAVSGVSGAADFDMTSTKLPVYCVDNLDSYVSWIIDKLAQAIGNADILKRKLFTDVEVIRHRRQSMMIVTAHNPKFTREDVTSRLLLITLDEVTATKLREETGMINHIVKHRAALWTSIFRDVQNVMRTPRPPESTVRWRIQDFASMGEWIAIALGSQDDFNEGLRALLNTQSDTIIQQEELLSTVITQLNMTESLSATDLWNLILVHLGANANSFIHTYKNPIRLAQKLVTMRPALSHIVRIEKVVDDRTRTQKWRITNV